MGPAIIALLVSISTFLTVIALLPPQLLKKPYGYTKRMLEKLEQQLPQPVEGDGPVLREQMRSSDILSRFFMMLPGSQALYPKLLRAGLHRQIGVFFGACLLVGILALLALSKLGIAGILVALICPWLFGRAWIRRRIQRRNQAFMEYFPEALDMIVRSVRSGYPINASIRMVADNMQPPLSTEFRQVADEIAYGSTLIEALQRLAERVDEPDIRFFVVVLGVQQDMGGSLAEILGNLSSVIRKRKYLRMKIKALSAEGRASAWVLGSLPFVEAIFIYAVAPNHLTPLVATPTGQMVLAATLGIALLGVVAVRHIVAIKV